MVGTDGSTGPGRYPTLNLRGLIGIRTRGCRMIGTEGSTGHWRLPDITTL